MKVVSFGKLLGRYIIISTRIIKEGYNQSYGISMLGTMVNIREYRLAVNGLSANITSATSRNPGEVWYIYKSINL